MPVKDYYSILALPASADYGDVKRAFRQLALQYHPDKTAGDQAAQLRYAEIKEAYDVLSDPARKDRYLQDRWVQKVYNQPLKNATLPENTLLSLIKLKKYSRTVDDFRGGQEQLANSLAGILEKHALEQIKILDDPAITRQVIELSIAILRPVRFQLKGPVLDKLLVLPDPQLQFRKRIAAELHRGRQEEAFEKWRIPFLLLLVLIICIGIYLLNK